MPPYNYINPYVFSPKFAATLLNQVGKPSA